MTIFPVISILVITATWPSAEFLQEAKFMKLLLPREKFKPELGISWPKVTLRGMNNS